MKFLKRFLSLFLISIILTGCGNNNVDNTMKNDLSSETFEDTYINYIYIKDNLYYNEYTNLVYFIFEEGVFDQTHSRMSPCYTPNGNIYKWNPRTNNLEEIINDEIISTPIEDFSTNFICIKENLYYNESTYIIYTIQKEGIFDQTHSRMSAFYAENGIPYKWDITTEKLKEIKK